jgi:CRISPR/Cas system-associated protein Cas5 (RAMP superfamily)
LFAFIFYRTLIGVLCCWRRQDGLKRRLDKLKKNIEEASAAVDQEREKNVSLLHLIFPPDIAKRLWLGRSRDPVGD